MKKKILALTLALVMALALVPGTALAVDSDFTVENGVLTHYNGPGGHVSIPEGVTGIWNVWDGTFGKRTDLTSVTIPDTVTEIAERAFYECTGLTDIVVEEDNPNYVSQNGVLFNKDRTKLIRYPAGRTDKTYVIPDSVTDIEYGAFADCTSLTNVMIPDSVIRIGYVAFDGCTSLTSLTIPDSVTLIGGVAFAGCTNLASVTIGNNVTAIGEETFAYCTSLTEVTIPSSVTSIGHWAFHECTSLTTVTLQANLPKLEEGMFARCAKLADVTVSGNVKAIGQDAFITCRSLRRVILEPGVTTIDQNAFSGCNTLEDITIPSTVTTIRGQIIPDSPQTTLHVAPGSVAEVYAQNMGLSYVTDQPYIDPALYAPVVETVTAYPSTQTVLVFDKPFTFQMYAIREENGYLTNYIKLRDLAYVVKLEDAEDQQESLFYMPEFTHMFQVDWDGIITVTRETNYTENGTEMKTPFAGERTCVHGPMDVRLKGGFLVDPDWSEIHTLDSLQIQDDAGNGYTYFKLRDLGALLDYTVRWDAEKGISIGY